MKIKLFLLMFCFATTSVVGQGIIKREKCKTCGKVITLCPHKGKHLESKPKPQSVPKPASKASYSNNVLSVGSVKYIMKPVEGGTFTMGATTEQQNPRNDEKPTHQVTLSSFYIGETEVTQALWTAVMGNTVEQIAKANGWQTHGVGKDYPMYYISWNDCQEFISKLNSLTGQNFRLPTEAEWEYSARGGNKSKGYQYSGANNINNVAWYNDNSGNKTHPIKAKQPNELGIYDMSGNVWEWCYDWKGDYSSGFQTNPEGPSYSTARVRRGGSWYSSARYSRSAFRYSNIPSFRDNDLGFRLVLSE